MLKGETKGRKRNGLGEEIWGGTSVRKLSTKGIEKGQLRVNSLLVSTLVSVCPEPDQNNLFYYFFKFLSNSFLG